MKVSDSGTFIACIGTFIDISSPRRRLATREKPTNAAHNYTHFRRCDCRRLRTHFSESIFAPIERMMHYSALVFCYSFTACVCVHINSTQRTKNKNTHTTNYFNDTFPYYNEQFYIPKSAAKTEGTDFHNFR